MLTAPGRWPRQVEMNRDGPCACAAQTWNVAASPPAALSRVTTTWMLLMARCWDCGPDPR